VTAVAVREPAPIYVDLPQLLSWQAQVVREARGKRFKVLAVGRRAGKTALGVDRLIHPALAGYPVAYFAPTYKMMNDVWRQLKAYLSPVAVKDGIHEGERRIDLITGGWIDMWSLDHAESILGRAYKRIVVDECAVVPELEEAWTRILRPELVDYQGDAWFLSTPKGLNFYHTLYRHYEDGHPDWRSWQLPTSVNPLIPASELAAARESMSEAVYAQEHEAAFISDATSVFRNLDVCSVARGESQADPNCSYVMGIDWARSNDFTVVNVFNMQTRAQAYFGRWTQVNYQVQRERAAAIAAQFRPVVIVSLSTGLGDPLTEDLGRTPAWWTADGLLPVRAFVETNETKAQAVEDLISAFDHRSIRIMPLPVQKTELQTYMSERLPSGKIRYSAPSGAHDDTVSAMYAAWSAIAHKPHRPKTVRSDLSVYRV
jgi:hypothetical protein